LKEYIKNIYDNEFKIHDEGILPTFEKYLFSEKYLNNSKINSTNLQKEQGMKVGLYIMITLSVVSFLFFIFMIKYIGKC